MKKILSLVLSVLMLISILPMTAGAAATDMWDVLTFVQDGPEFSVVAEGFEAADTSYTFTAVAYKGAEVHDTKEVAATLAGDELSASVNFEEGGEADVAISSVEVTLTNSLSEVVGETKTFAVIPQSVTDNVYNNFTNGFYEPVVDGVDITVASSIMYRYKKADNKYTNEYSNGTGLTDRNLTTRNALNQTADGVTTNNGIYWQDVVKLSASTPIDRVIAYPYSSTGVRFYLSNNVNTSGYMEAHFGSCVPETTTHTYLGDNTNAKSVTKVGDNHRYVFDANGGSYQYLIADYRTGSYTANYDMQLYRKVSASQGVDSNKPASVTFKQEGAKFSVLATKLKAEIACTECTLIAVARDSEGVFVDQKVATGNVNSGTFSASVDFEEGGKEARVDIASVELTLTDEDNKIVAEETFAVTVPSVGDDGIYTSFTNGFYEPVVDGETVTVASSTMTRYNKESLTKTHTYSNGTGLTDHNLTTRNLNNQTADSGSNVGIYWNDFVNLSADAKIDRIVAYPASQSSVRFFLSETACSTDGDMNAYLSALTPDSTTYTYLGDKDTAKSVKTLTVGSNSMRRFVFDTDGGTYRALIADYRTGALSANYDMQAYKKVTDTKKATEIIAKVNRVELESENFKSANIALNVPAFSYGSAAGTNESFAVDGDETTAWISANTSDRRDFLILDLGAEYSIGGLKLTLAEGSDSNFKVYGMNALTNNARNNSLNQNVDATEFNRSEITGVLNLTPGVEEEIISICYDPFRYLVFEQAAGAGTVFGFAEIKAYTMGRVDASYEAKPVAKAKGELAAFSNSISENGGAATISQNNEMVTDADPSTGASLSITFGHNGAHYINAVMLDVGKEGMGQKVSYLTYQAEDATYASRYSYFVLVGADVLPADGYVTGEGKSVDAEITSIKNFDVLARFDGASDSIVSGETGLMVFEVPEAKRKAYRYVGVLKYDATDARTIRSEDGVDNPQLELNVGTLQAYTTCEDVLEAVEKSGDDRIMDVETATVTADAVTYSAKFWNGTTSGNVIGILTHYNDEGAIIGESVYADCGKLVPGAYNSIGFEEAVSDGLSGTWELTLLCDRQIYDRIEKLGAKKQARVEFYNGESLYDNINSSRVGTTAQSGGTVDSGIVGMVILKPDADAAHFGASDVYDHIFAEAPAGNEGSWNYSLRYTVPADAPGNVGDEYTACLLSCNDSLTGETPVAIPVFDETEIKSDFAEAEADEIADLMTSDHEGYFGSEIVADISALVGNDAAAKEAFGEKFRLSQAAFIADVFDKNLNDIEIIPAATQAALVIDATLSGADVAETIAAYGASMPLIFDTPYYDAADFEEILPNVLSSVAPGTEASKENAEKLAKAYKRAIALSTIANADRDDLEDVKGAITTYSKELGIDELLASTSQEPVSIATELVITDGATDIGTVETNYAGGMKTVIEGIIKALDKKDETPTYDGVGTTSPGKNNNNNNKKPSTQVPSLPYDLWDEQDVQPTQKPESAISKETGFYDIDAHTWAHSAIKTMKERDIIDGVSDDAFDPDGLLTREQTAKLIVLSMSLKTTVEDNGYRDCVRGAWYYPFISSAKQHGLVTGLTRTEFGLGKNITRQDLAVIIYRALDKLDLARGKEEKAFADDAAISPYAKKAVGVLGNMGIITGFEDGSFGPGQNATRAQASVIFARFLDVVDAAAEAAANAGEEG